MTKSIRIVDLPHPDCTPRRAGDIPTGRPFYGKIGPDGKGGYYHQGLFVRAGAQSCAIFSLSNPEDYWTDAESVEVHDFREVAIAVTVHTLEDFNAPV